MRRILAGILSLALVALSPGLEPYGALAATVAPRVQAKIGSPAAVVSGNPLSAPKLPGSVLGQTGSLPLLTPSVIPVVTVNPAAQTVTLVDPAAVVGAARVKPAVLETVAPVLETVTAELSKPGASNESTHSTGRRLDGTYSRDKDDQPVVVPAVHKPNPVKRWLQRTALAVGLSLAVISGAQAQTSQGAHNVPVPVAAVAQDTAKAQVAKAPVTASLQVEGRDLTVGSRVKLTLTLKNDGAAPLTFGALRTAVNDALPENIEVVAGDEASVTLAPGETRTFVFEAEVWASGKFELGASPVALQTPEGPQVFDMPAATVEVATVLTPDWKQKGFRDISAVLNALTPSLLWLTAIPLGLLMLYGVERFIAARRKYPALTPDRLPIVLEAQQKLAALEKTVNDDDARGFYTELQAALDKFAVDFAGVKPAERDASELIKALKASKAYKTGPVQVVAELARRAESVRFGRANSTSAQRASDLRSARALIDFVAAGQKNKNDGQELNGVGAAGFSFAAPWVLLLLIPAGLMLAWQWRKSRAPGYSVASASKLPGSKSLRNKLWWLPRSLRATAMLAILVALAGPQLGVDRQTTIQPSADKMFVLDLSGSMDEAAGHMTKLQAATRSIATVANEARRGTQDRIGLTTFSDESYIDIKLTTDYDAIIAHLKELHTSGSTAIGKGMLSAIGHFIELNILEEAESTDPRMQEVVRLLRTDGLPAALEYAKNDKQLMDQIIRPERKKAVIVFTDGQSNAGITPVEASFIAKKLGIKVYTVGIGSGGGLDETTLMTVAENTGAQYFRADDPQRMAEVMHEISRMEKSPVKIVSTVAVNDLSKWFVLLALLGFGFELALVNTRLRTLHAMAFALTLPLAAPIAVAPTSPAPYVQFQSASQPALPDPGPVLSIEKLPAEALQANRAYAEGRYDEALKLYTRALERYPDLIELHYNIANTYFKLGDAARAKASYERFLALNKDPKLASRALYNLGNVALMAKDAQAAKEMYKEALRKNPSNLDAKWNLEVLNKLMEEQEKQNQDQKQQGQKGKKDKKGGKDKQQGQPGEGEPGEGEPGEGEPGDKPGKPGESKPGDKQGKDKKPGEGEQKPGDKEKSGADELGEKLGEQEGKQKAEARKGLKDKGKGAYAFLGLGGTALTFGSPLYLWALAIGVPLVVGLIAYGWYKSRQAAKVVAPATAPKNFSGWWGRRRFLTKSAAITLAAGMLAMAAADPRSGYRDERLNFGGKDVMVTVDGSYSLIYAEDGRLERTKKELTEFVTRLQGTDRIGLVVFSGGARTASPLSIDYGNFEYKIGKLDTEARGLPEGSNLANAIIHTARSFHTAKKLGDRQRVMIVISDGDVTAGELSAAIAAARETGITIYTIGVGSIEGTRMKVPTEDGKGTTYIGGDNPALTKLVEAPLRELANATGGSYFRASQGTTMTAVMERIASMQQGEKGDSIRSPRPVGWFFLLPALLLLLADLLLPNRSLLRREDAPEVKKPEGKTGLLAGLGLLPTLSWSLPSVPLSSWQEILPFAIALAALLGLGVYELFTRGGISHFISDALAGRLKTVRKGVERDFPALLSVRQSDEGALRSFLSDWEKKGGPERRAELVAQALGDSKLWREKLILAALSGADPESEELVYAALGQGRRKHLESPQALIEGVLKAYPAVGWLQHADIARRLSRLALAGLEKPSAELLAPLAGHYDALAAGAAREALGLEPLPEKRPRTRGNKLKLRAAVAFLAASLLLTGTAGYKTVQLAEQQNKEAAAAVALFYGADNYVFSDTYVDSRINEYVLPALRNWNKSGWTAERELLTALEVLRSSPDPKADNLLETIFKRADYLPLTGQSEGLLLHILVERENVQVWRFIISHLEETASDPRAAARAMRMIQAAAESEKEHVKQNIFFFLYSPNPQIQEAAAATLMTLYMEKPELFFPRLGLAQQRFAGDPTINIWVEMMALQRVAMGGADAAQALAALANVRTSLRGMDKGRVAFMEQQLAKLKPGQPLKMPPSFIESYLSIMGGSLQNGQASDAVKTTVRASYNKSVTELIEEGEGHFAALHDTLVARGVALPDRTSSGYYGGRDDYDDHHGYYGRGYYGGGSYTSKQYREIYKLAQLRELKKAVAEQLAAAGPGAKTAQVEYAARLDAAIDQILKNGAAAGMLEGGSAGEKAAELVNAVLGEAPYALQDLLHKKLAADSLAPAGGTGQAKYYEQYTPEQLDKIDAVLRGLVNDSLPWDQRVWLSKALQKVAEVRGQPMADVPALEAARMSLSMGALKDDLKAMDSLLLRAAKTVTSEVDLQGLVDVYVDNMKSKDSAAQAWTTLAKALEGRASTDVLAAVVRKRAVADLHKILEEAESAYSLKPKTKAAGLRWKDYGNRPGYTLYHIDALERLVKEAAPAKGAALTPAQVKAGQTVKSVLPELRRAAALAGLAKGGTAAELAADKVNPVLDGASWTIKAELRKTLDAAKSTVKSFEMEAYSEGELAQLEAALRAAAGDSLGWSDKRYLAGAIKTLAEARRASPAPLPSSLSLAELSLQMAEKSKDAAFQERALRQALALPGTAAEMEELVGSYLDAFALEEDLPAYAGALKRLASLAEGRPAGDKFVVALRGKIMGNTAVLVALGVELFALKDTAIAEGLLWNEHTARETFTLRHMDLAAKLIAAEAKKTAKPSEQQELIAKMARELFPVLRQAAVAVGVPSGLSRGERAADKLNPILKEGYDEWPGREFNDKLIDAGFAPKVTDIQPDLAYKQAYTRAELTAMRKFFADWLASGVTGATAHDADQKAVLEKAVKAIDVLLADKQLHGGLGMTGGEDVAAAVLAGVGLSWLSWIVGGAVILGALLWFWSKWREPLPAAAARAGEPSEDVLARYRRIEVRAKKLATSSMGGFFRSPFIGGSGTDWAEAVEYTDEDLRDVDWKASAKAGSLQVKTFEQERDMPVILLVDMSRSGSTGGTGDKRQVIEDSAALLALAAAHSNLRVGAIFFTDKVEAYIPPQGGVRHAQELVRRMLNFKPAGTKTDLGPALALTLKNKSGRAVVPVISDFISPDFKTLLGAAAKRHDLRPIIVSDPQESKPLPAVGLIRLVDSETGEERLVDTSNKEFRASQSALVRRQNADLRQSLQDVRAVPIELVTGSDYLQTLAESFKPKTKAQ